jgi:flagellar biogenesis protein FliO
VIEALQQVLAVCLVLGLAAVSAYALRRSSLNVAARSGSRLQVIEKVQLTPGAALYLVRMGTREYYLGVGPGGVQVLATEERQEHGEGKG